MEVKICTDASLWRLQMGADLERVQRERDAALARLSQQSSSSETMEQELEAARKQLRRVEVCVIIMSWRHKCGRGVLSTLQVVSQSQQQANVRTALLLNARAQRARVSCE